MSASLLQYWYREPTWTVTFCSGTGYELGFTSSTVPYTMGVASQLKPWYAVVATLRPAQP